MTDPYADWNLGHDNLAANTLKALRAASVTPAAAAAMTPAELAAIPGLGKTRLARVRERLARTGAEPGSEAAPPPGLSPPAEGPHEPPDAAR